MIGLDTNVLVRFIVRDDPDQALAASRLVNEVLSPENKGFISSVVICELTWVLRKVLKVSKEGILSVINMLLDSSSFTIEHRECVSYAVRDYANGEADFSDYYLAEIGCETGCLTATFDEKALRHPHFKRVRSFLKNDESNF